MRVKKKRVLEVAACWVGNVKGSRREDILKALCHELRTHLDGAEIVAHYFSFWASGAERVPMRLAHS